MADTKIEWAEKVWNPIVGCTKCSPGCLNCYAERMASRLSYMGQEKYSYVVKPRHIDEKRPWNNKIFCDESVLDQPLHWRKPCRIFVCSMSDLFHEKVPFDFRLRLWRVMSKCQQHTFLILSKRAEIMKHFVGEWLAALKGDISFPVLLPNVHLGVSISNQDEMWKAMELKRIPAAVRWISFEPLLEPVEFEHDRLFCDRDPEEDSPVACVPCRCGNHWENGTITTPTLNCIDWVVVGGESGPGARPMQPDWVRNIRDQCVAAGVPFFFKQWGEYYPVMGEGKVATSAKPPKAIYVEPGPVCMFRVGKKKAGSMLDDWDWKQLPERR